MKYMISSIAEAEGVRICVTAADRRAVANKLLPADRDAEAEARALAYADAQRRGIAREHVTFDYRRMFDMLLTLQEIDRSGIQCISAEAIYDLQEMHFIAPAPPGDPRGFVVTTAGIQAAGMTRATQR